MGDTGVVPTPIDCDDDLRSAMAARLVAHDRLESALEGRRHAAVALVIVDSQVGDDAEDPYEFSAEEMQVIPGYTPERADELDGRMAGVAGGASFVLCRRSAGLRSHASQWALPGGRLDEGEDVIDAALRETWEEVGVRFGRDRVLGILDDYVTRSGYVMTPVVVWGGRDVELVPNPDEVLAVYRIGLHELARDDSPRFVEIPESDRPVVQVPLGGDLIHAPTGAVLVNFRWVCLDGRPSAESRVDQFEQPVFAWG